MIKAKYGFVALVDALGTKTNTIDFSIRYLKAIDSIEQDVKDALEAVFEYNGSVPRIFKDLSIRFFGDTILMTYQVKWNGLEHDCFDTFSFILRGFISNAFERGILFRGSLSLGDYIEHENAVLGPAVFDTAEWYDKLDMIGIITTPKTTIALKKILPKNLRYYRNEVVLDSYPTKTGTPTKTFALNWPAYLNLGKNRMETPEQRFYKYFNKFPKPVGTRSKFDNTEQFFLRNYKY